MNSPPTSRGVFAVSIHVNCPNCSAGLKAPADAAGKLMKCPKCSAKVRVPYPTANMPTGSIGVGMPVEIKVPAIDGLATESILSRWIQKDRDYVRADEPVAEMLEGKWVEVIYAPAAGRLRIVVPEGKTVQVGAVIGRVEEGAAVPIPAKQPAAPAAPIADAASVLALAEPSDASHETRRQPTLIDKYEEDYKHALAGIDHDVKRQIDQCSEMAALCLFNQHVSKILEVREALSGLYSIVWHGLAVLKHFDSERLRKLGHEPVATYDILRTDDFFRSEASKHGDPDEFIERMASDALWRLGFQRKHWWLKGRVLAEIEYMIEALKILVEPEFIPLTPPDATGTEEERPDRYVSSEVKIAVWRRDGGKCVECGSKEKLEYDHIIPIAKGGSNTERNIQLLCEKCNRKKADGIH